MAVTHKALPIVTAFCVVAGLFALGYMYWPDSKPMFVPNPHLKELRIGTTTITVNVARTNEERSKGLSGIPSLSEGSGMWFVFDQDGLWPFWMKDTLIALDMLWVAADGTIVTIAHNVAPESYPQVFMPTKPARYVLEVPAGFAAKYGIAEGDQVVF
jgi:uncharacterized protein